MQGTQAAYFNFFFKVILRKNCIWMINTLLQIKRPKNEFNIHTPAAKKLRIWKN